MTALVIVSGLAVMGSAVNLIRVEWANDHRAPASRPEPPPDAGDRSWSEQVEDLQRQLNVLERQNSEGIKARAAKSNALIFLEMSAALMFFLVAVMGYLRRRAGKA